MPAGQGKIRSAGLWVDRLCRGGAPGRRLRLLHAALAILAVTVALLPDAQAAAVGDQLKSQRQIAAPEGFSTVCDAYGWACARLTGKSMADDDLVALASEINETVNASVTEISDSSQYGVADLWALPTARGGDCEDMALLKKQMMLQRGVGSDRLLIATVLDRTREPHAVLILRSAAGDLVLDNLDRQIKPWRSTGYSFLRMQDPGKPEHWVAVLAGGVFAADKL